MVTPLVTAMTRPMPTLSSFVTAVACDSGLIPLLSTAVMKEESVGIDLVTTVTRGMTNTGCSFSSLLLLVTGVVLHSTLVMGMMSL